MFCVDHVWSHWQERLTPGPHFMTSTLHSLIYCACWKPNTNTSVEAIWEKKLPIHYIKKHYNESLKNSFTLFWNELQSFAGDTISSYWQQLKLQTTPVILDKCLLILYWYFIKAISQGLKIQILNFDSTHKNVCHFRFQTFENVSLCIPIGTSPWVRIDYPGELELIGESGRQAARN